MIWSVSMLSIGQRHQPAFEVGERLHSSVLTSVTTPVMALAAAVSGLARKVRPPLPCRPSKLRLLVETLYWPGCSWSPFMAMHMEQPGSRHSQPASRKISVQALGLRLALDLLRPGTTITRTFGLTLRPFSTAAAARRSEMRELVQLPMKTTSIGMAQQRLAGLAGPCSAAPWRCESRSMRVGDLRRIGHRRR